MYLIPRVPMFPQVWRPHLPPPARVLLVLAVRVPARRRARVVQCAVRPRGQRRLARRRRLALLWRVRRTRADGHQGRSFLYLRAHADFSHSRVMLCIPLFYS